jgi:hypothetical protein
MIELKKKLTERLIKRVFNHEELINEIITDFKESEEFKQLILCDVAGSKRKSNADFFNQMNNDFMQAIIDSDNGVYDPVEEFGKELENKYIIIEK